MIAVIATRRAGQSEPDCPSCDQPVERGQRIVLVRDDEGAHAWIHIRHVIERALRQLVPPPVLPFATEDTTSTEGR